MHGARPISPSALGAALAIAALAGGCAPARRSGGGGPSVPAMATAPALSSAVATALCASMIEDEATLQGSAVEAGGLPLPDDARADVVR